MSAVDEAVSTVKDALWQGVSWGRIDFDVGHDELSLISETLADLTPAQRNEVISRLSDDNLKNWAQELYGHAGSLDKSERDALFNDLAQGLDADQFIRLVDAFENDGNGQGASELRAAMAGLPLRHIAAVCPLVDPARTMVHMEQAPQFYDWYFRRKWRSSLVRKRELFPDRYPYDDTTLGLDLRGLMGWLAQRHAGFGSVEAYFDSYSIAGARLAALEVPADILMSRDDPVIPFDDFQDWQLPSSARLEVASWGGHCAFVENLHGDGFAERWVAHRLCRSLQAR